MACLSRLRRHLVWHVWRGKGRGSLRGEGQAAVGADTPLGYGVRVMTGPPRCRADADKLRVLKKRGGVKLISVEAC